MENLNIVTTSQTETHGLYVVVDVKQNPLKLLIKQKTHVDASCYKGKLVTNWISLKLTNALSENLQAKLQRENAHTHSWTWTKNQAKFRGKDRVLVSTRSAPTPNSGDFKNIIPSSGTHLTGSDINFTSTFGHCAWTHPLITKLAGTSKRCIRWTIVPTCRRK